MPAGRVYSYIHSDGVTVGKGGVLVDVRCDTDFAAKSTIFEEFCKKVASLAFAFQVTDYKSLNEISKEAGMSIEEARLALQKELKEKVWVPRISTSFLLDDEVESYESFITRIK